MAPHAAACEGGLASSSSVSRDCGERRPRGDRAASMRAPPPPPRDCRPGMPSPRAKCPGEQSCPDLARRLAALALAVHPSSARQRAGRGAGKAESCCEIATTL